MVTIILMICLTIN